MQFAVFRVVVAHPGELNLEVFRGADVPLAVYRRSALTFRANGFVPIGPFRNSIGHPLRAYIKYEWFRRRARGSNALHQAVEQRLVYAYQYELRYFPVVLLAPR